MKMRDRALSALKVKYEADIIMADYNITNYLDNPVAIGEHPQLLDELDKFVDAKANAEDKLHIINRLLDPERGIYNDNTTTKG